MSTTPGNRRVRGAPPQAPYTHTCAFRRKQRRSSLSSHRRGVRKSLHFEEKDKEDPSSSKNDAENDNARAAEAASSFIKATSHLARKESEDEQKPPPPVPNFWNNPPPPPSSPPSAGDAKTVQRRSMRLRTKVQFGIAQITDSSPNQRAEPTSDLLFKNKPQSVIFDECSSDYGTCSESSTALYFRPSSNSAFSIASGTSSHSHSQELFPSFHNSKNSQSHSSEPSSQSVGYVSDLDEVLSNLSIDDALGNSKLQESKRWDSDENIDENSEWEQIPNETCHGSHLGLKDLHLKNVKACFKTLGRIGVLSPLDGYEIIRPPKRSVGHGHHHSIMTNRYDLRRRPHSQLDKIITIQTYDINMEGKFLSEGLRLFQVSPIISIKPHEVEFVPLLPATIQIPLEIEPLAGEEVHCLYCKSSVEDIHQDYTKIPWKSVEAGKFAINNGMVYFETFHFGLFVLVIRPKSPFSSRMKEIRTRVGGKLTINDFPSIEVLFPKEATDDVIIRAQASAYLDTEESVSEFLANRLLKLSGLNESMEVDDTGDGNSDCLATPILQLEPHGIQFNTSPVMVTLPVPDYDSIMTMTNGKAKLSIWQSNTQLHETSRWEKLQVEYEIRRVKVAGEIETVVTFPVTHFSFFKGVWESISNYLSEAKVGMFYYFVSFAMKCQANMEEYGNQTATATKAEDGDENQQVEQSGGSHFGLEVSIFQADKPWPPMTTYKYKVGTSNPKLVKPGRILVRLKSQYFIPDVDAGEEEEMVKEETDFRGKDFEKQFICKFKPNVNISRGPFGKVLVSRCVSQRQKGQPIFEFNIQKHGHEAEVAPVDYQSEQWSIVALRELANNLFVTDGENWKQFAQEVGMTKQEIRDANLKNDLDPFQKIVNHYRQRGGTPEELVAVLYRCHRTIKIKGNFSPQSSSNTKSSNGSSGRGSLSSNNANFDRFGGSHDSDTSGKTSGTRTSQDSGLPAGRKRSAQMSNRGSGGGSLSSSQKAKRKRISEPLPGPSHRYNDERQSDADEEASDSSDVDRVPPAPPSSLKAQSIASVEGQARLKNDKSVLDSRFLWQISECLNVSNWKALGRTLGLEEGTLVEVDHAFSKTSFRECSYQMLLDWKQRFPRKCTFGTLYSALIKEGMAAAAKQMEEIDPTADST